MNLLLAYYQRSTIFPDAHGLAISLAPNLRRDRVSYNGVLRDPVRFREAISALHDIVVADFRYKPGDKSAYQAFRAQMEQRERQMRTQAGHAVRRELTAQLAVHEPEAKALEQRFNKLRTRYWQARDEYARYLSQHDPELFRKLLPCDPVITVAADVLFFECFSADESGYGCLSVDRDAFSSEQDIALGTTNVDYSWDLYEHFQQLRTYRETRFRIDPAGFTVAVAGGADYREEKIDLPPSWLRGFMQMQAVQSLPMRRVALSREALYSILAFLRRHRARRSPRAVRFELTPGQPVIIALEPWEQRIALPETKYEGQRAETIRTWGRDRLRVLARLLPLIDRVEVYLIGTGLPSFWVAHLGPMRLTLGLSGWTANDWTAANSLDQILPPAEPSNTLTADIAAAFKAEPSLTFQQIRQRTGAAEAFVAAGLHRLAYLGQVIHDLPAGRYRWRQILPVALSMEQLGPDNPETVAARDLVAKRVVKVTQDEMRPDGMRLIEGQVDRKDNALVLNGDGRIIRGQCNCSYHFTGRLRKGPCRHLQALRNTVLGGVAQTSLQKWFSFLWN